MKQIFLALTLILGFSSCSQSPSPSGAEGDQIAAHIDVTEFSEFENVEGAQLLDVRTPGEFNQDHIAGAVNINVNSRDFSERVAELDKSKAVYVYCRSGARSANAMGQLQRMGFEEVYNLKGGILAWKRAGKAVE